MTKREMKRHMIDYSRKDDAWCSTRCGLWMIANPKRTATRWRDTTCRNCLRVKAERDAD